MQREPAIGQEQWLPSRCWGHRPGLWRWFCGRHRWEAHQGKAHQDTGKRGYTTHCTDPLTPRLLTPIPPLHTIPLWARLYDCSRVYRCVTQCIENDHTIDLTMIFLQR